MQATLDMFFSGKVEQEKIVVEVQEAQPTVQINTKTDEKQRQADLQ